MANKDHSHNERIKRIERVVLSLCKVARGMHSDYTWQKDFDSINKFVEDLDGSFDEEEEDDESR